jgi:uncharacterized protein
MRKQPKRNQPKHALRWLTAALLSCLCLISLGGCSSHTKRLQGPRHEFFSNDLTAAHANLSKLSKKRQDHTVAELDLAIVELFQGNAVAAEKRLREVRSNWEDLEQKSLTESASSYLTDDSAKQYAGETYEKMLIGVFLTLSSLMRDGTDAEAYTLQTLTKQQKIVEQLNGKREEPLSELFGIPPIVPYVRGVMREATFHDNDDALRMYQLTSAMLPDHPQLAEDIRRAQQGNHSQPGHGVVYVVALVGRGPYKVETSADVTQLALLQVDQIVSALGDYSVPPTLAPIKVPAMSCPPKHFDLIGIELNGMPRTTTLPMTDLERIAVETHEAQLPTIMARTVVRRIVKKGAIYAAKSQMMANDLSSIALDVAGVAWEATEAADTRCWGLLPREIQIARLELPVGRHQLALEPITSGRPTGIKTPCLVDVHNARNTFVMGFWPDSQPIGQVLVNTP